MGSRPRPRCPASSPRARLRAAARGGGTLRVVGVADQQKPLTDLIAAYRKSHPAPAFSTSYAPTDQVQTVVRTQLGAGNAPDVHVVYPGSGSAMSMVEIAKAGLLADLERPGVDQDRSRRASSPRSSTDGKTYLYSAGSQRHRRDLQQEGLRARPGRAAPRPGPSCSTSAPSSRRPGEVADRARRADAVGHPADHLRAGALDASTPRTRTFDDEHAGRAGELRRSPAGATPWACTWSCRSAGFFNDNPNGTTYEQQTSMVGHRQGGHGRPGVGRAAGLPRGRHEPRRPGACSRSPAPTTAADGVDPGGRRRRSRRERAKRQERDAGQGVHRVPRPAGEHQPLGRGGRRDPAQAGRELQDRPGR